MVSSSKQTHKLTREEALTIRSLHETGATQAALAKQFGVSAAAVSAIVNMKVHVRDPYTLEERRERKRQGRFLAAYGIDVDRWESYVEAIGRKCEVCGRQESDLRRHVVSGRPLLVPDHDHVSGSIRGALCADCNSGIGLLGDTLDAVLSAASYLRKSSPIN